MTHSVRPSTTCSCTRAPVCARSRQTGVSASSQRGPGQHGGAAAGHGASPCIPLVSLSGWGLLHCGLVAPLEAPECDEYRCWYPGAVPCPQTGLWQQVLMVAEGCSTNPMRRTIKGDPSSRASHEPSSGALGDQPCPSAQGRYAVLGQLIQSTRLLQNISHIRGPAWPLPDEQGP